MGPGSAVEKKTKKIGERCEPSSSPPQSTARLALLAEFFLLLFVCRFTPFFTIFLPRWSLVTGHSLVARRKKGSFLVINK